MKAFKFQLAALITVVTIMTVTLAANKSNAFMYNAQKTNAVVDVTTSYSLMLNEAWGYNKESSKTVTSSEDNDFTIGFSDGSKFGAAGSGLAFTTTENGLYIYNSTVLNGVSQVYVTGTSTNDNAAVTVYSHYDSQTYCQLDSSSQRTIGSLNSLIEFTPAKYVAIRFEGIDEITSVEIGYSCDAPSQPIFRMKSGGQNTDSNGLFQSMTGLSTEYAVGTAVTVTMDVYVTGTYDVDACKIWWVDDVYTTAGGESNKARTDIKSTIVTGDAGWHTVTFDATVRNFPNLRSDTKYTTTSTSEFGNAVYLIAVTHGTLQSFDYRNVTITKQYETMIDYGTKGTAYHQTLGVLESSLAVGTSVYVEMDVIRTGAFDKWSSVGWVNGTDGANAATRVSIKTEFGIASDSAWTENDWQHVSFVATIRNFDVLRKDANYSLIDTSNFGNGVYLLTENNDSRSFNYRNVVLQEVVSAPAAQKDSSGNYYTSYIGFTADGLAEGTDVHVSLDMYYTGGIDANTVVYALDKSSIQWGGGAYADGLHMIKVVENGGVFPTSGFTNIEFDTKVYSHSNAIHWGASGATFDVSTYGICVLLCFKNATNSVSPASFKNIVITVA